VAEALPARSADGTTYTFTIRPGFRFSPPSNQPVTAQTFKDTIERTLNPKMNSGYGPEFSDIVGEAAYTAGKAPHICGSVDDRG
jgi:ABC-type transport system substrate-binding protein